MSGERPWGVGRIATAISVASSILLVTTLLAIAAFRRRTSCTVSSRCNDHTSSRQRSWSQIWLSAAHSRDKDQTPCSPDRRVAARRNGHSESHSTACAHGTSGRERVASAPPDTGRPTFRMDNHRPVMWWEASHETWSNTPILGREQLPQEVKVIKGTPDADSLFRFASP